MNEVDHSAFSGARAMVTGGLGFLAHIWRGAVELGADVTIVDSLIPEYGGNLYNVREIADGVRTNLSDIRDPSSIRTLVPNRTSCSTSPARSATSTDGGPPDRPRINGKAQGSRASRPVARATRACGSSRRLTSAVRAAPIVPVSEDHPLVPVDVNGINLIAGENYHLLYNRVHGIRAASLRLTNTYGPHLLMKHGRQGFVAVFIRLALEGKPMKVFGDGTQLRDFTYVVDAVDAFLATAPGDDAFRARPQCRRTGARVTTGGRPTVPGARRRGRDRGDGAMAAGAREDRHRLDLCLPLRA